MERVVDKFVAEVAAQLKERKVALELSPAARSWLAQKGYDPDFGARPMARVIQRELKDAIADAVLFGALAKGGTGARRSRRGQARLRVRDGMSDTPAVAPVRAHLEGLQDRICAALEAADGERALPRGALRVAGRRRSRGRACSRAAP